MENITLDTAFVDHGVPHVAFWNGRVLTAEDLRGEQLANQLGRNRLGRAIGSGVASGLSVRPGADASQVEVTAGVAVDPTGQVVELPVDVSLSLVVPPTTAQGDGVFTVCEPIASNPTGTGLYLLVIRPASDSRSSVAGVPAFGAGVATECGPRYIVDGVSFRLIGIDPIALAQAAGHDQDDLDVLAGLGSAAVSPIARNVLAHLFLDTRAWATRLLDPFGTDPVAVELGALARLRTGPLRPCEAPIALVTWSFGGVDSVDTWAVRRTPVTEAALTAVQGLGSRTREQLGRASYSQFQDQLALLLSELDPATRVGFRLPERFRYLPAAGLVPMARTGRTGFSTAVFDGLLVRDLLPLAPIRVGPLLDESFHHAAVDSQTGEVLNVYSVIHPDSEELDYLVFCTSRIDLIDDRPDICAVFPSNLLRLGQRIEIRGRNFGFTAGDNRVTFDGDKADALQGSIDTRLLVDVPVTLTVQPEGSRVMVEVGNGHGTDSVPVTIGQPDQGPIGQLHVNWVSVEPATITRGRPMVVHYTVLSTVAPAVDVDLVLDGPAGIVDAARLQDGDGNAIAGPVPMETGEVLFVDVLIGRVPNLKTFALSLTAKAGAIVGDDTRDFNTGQLTPPGDRAISFLTGVLEVPDGSIGELDGSMVRLHDGSSASLQVVVRLTEPGDYGITIGFPKRVDGWVLVLAEPPPDPPDSLIAAFPTVEQGEIDQDGYADRTVVISLERQGADQSQIVTLVVTRRGALLNGRTSYTLAPAR